MFWGVGKVNFSFNAETKPPGVFFFGKETVKMFFYQMF